MSQLRALIKRNTKLFFKDKGAFFTALITPAILLVLYATFLAKVYRDSFAAGMPEGVVLEENLLEGIVGGQLLSSLLAVCCVTVAFCANMLMVADKVTGARRDLTMTPVGGATLAMGYSIATFLVTFLIGVVALVAGLCYIAFIGWYLSVWDVVCLLGDVLLLTLFGTLLSSVIHSFLSTQGQISAVGTVVSAGYGFLCGAYMPMSQFGEGLRRVLSFLPGTYATVLFRHHAMRGAFDEMEAQHIPAAVVDSLRDTVDANLYFFDERVPHGMMFAVLGGSVVILALLYIFIQARMLRKKA